MKMVNKIRNGYVNRPLFILVACILCSAFLQQVEPSRDAEIVSSWAQEFGDELWQLGQKMTKSNEIKSKYKQYNARVEQKGNDTLIKSIVDNLGRMLQRKIDAVRCILNVAEKAAEMFEYDETEHKNYTYYSSKYSPINVCNMTAASESKPPAKNYYSSTHSPINDCTKTATSESKPPAKNYSYCSSKYSSFIDLNLIETAEFKGVELPKFILQNESDYQHYYESMFLNTDTHFYNIAVNTTHSSVHVPTNVNDRSPNVSATIIWSEALDKVFLQNYQSDPALSWQYFGSDTGIMRHFPGKIWDSNGVDVYDCRKRSWYIETATCSKDIVILLDNSGSMAGFRNFIAQLTVKSILDTFSNNDFINIFKYSNYTSNLVECFDSETLVQATPENIAVFNDEVKKLDKSDELKPQERANVTEAYVAAFKLLQTYRGIRKCNESSAGCNQAIMLITDGVPEDITKVFDTYNRIENNNLMKTPVRIFIYLLGKEVTDVEEMQSVACLNRGYYSHVPTLDQVQSEVLQYVKVLATPLVLQGEDHPPTWTHAFKDYFSDDDESDDDPEEDKRDKPARLMIAVGVPAFDKKINNQNGTLKSARLLGVASTDVPVEDINKLTLPYKLGVNAYSFIVSNNGYVLLHPDLRPVEERQLKPNYNSIDLTEVEQFDDSNPHREPGKQLLELREKLVFNKRGKMLNVSVKFHYDNMRRISQEKYDYYYAPLPNTPFSLGLAIPSGYGNTWIKVGDEVKRNLHLGVNMSDYFVGENFKVHPEWVYCKYHYLEGHEFNTPEEELRHFLKKLSDPNWKWSQQYEVEPKYQHDGVEETNEPDCGRKSLGDDAYYCNKELVQLLIFDAKVTNASYRTWEFENESERKLIETFNATLRFVATNSGLTRWQFIFGEVEVDTDKEFGDYHTYAVDETWYKSAILQHQIDPKSFVYSVPHNSEPKEDDDLKVTASHAIFPRDGGLEAPGLVVGFQFSHSMMYQRFMNITSKANCEDCIRPCNDDLQDCYVIDNNGYVVLSERENDTGKFFGELEGNVFTSMVQLKIFKNITVYDLQALCSKEVLKSNRGDLLWTPFKLVWYVIKWVVMEIVIHLSRIRMIAEGVPNGCDVHVRRKTQEEEEEEYYNRTIVIEYETIFRPCDKEVNLYILQQNLSIQGGNNLPSCGVSNCSRPYYFKRIPYSNLLLVVVKSEQPYNPEASAVKSKLKEIQYTEAFPCHKLKLNNLTRRRIDECFTEHPDEANVTYCGRAPPTFTSTSILLTILFSILRKIFYM